MTQYLITSHRHYSENTPEYGHGDYPEQIPFLVCVVEAETPRKAQNAAKKKFPNLRFGGQFGENLLEADSEFVGFYTSRSKAAGKRPGSPQRGAQ